MTKIKICGITRLQDALDAAEAGADALGFNFSSQSPRMIDPEKAKDIINKLPPFIQSAGIFVDNSAAEIKAICRYCKLQIVQLHSEEYTPQQARSIKEAKVIKVFRPDNNFSVEEVSEFSKESGVTTFLFDAYQPGIAGGTGQSIGKSLASRIFNELNSSFYTILAGGLNHSNVGDAIRQTKPYGVDTASGVERAPGIKDKEKMKTFIRAVREITYEGSLKDH
ncbi:MAG: phosphoribosylanthranilate isomerase [Chlorobiaceae bacterium]|nr:phosphoribosylanthranilate isomerase [Chlorobiaceae bacterium]